jgi:site-specific DNA recombinase
MPEVIKRCAIYTRKSFEPPAGQEITSLESQRAICSSYVASQQHRRWVEIASHYDDSGRTGADTHRPALQQLLSDVEAGLVDVVLIYKLDRLTRTLFDFVRLTDFLDRHGVALVSITQNFDTSDSLGRLVLNILLTFAQFEREILSDRMRDKIRVLKQMGRWVGGSPPLGYDVVKKKLIANPNEAQAVRTIFKGYLETHSIEAVHRRLQGQGFRRKVWKARTGAVFGGGIVTLSSLHHILRNPIYVGEVSHRGEVYPGIHQPIVERHVFEEVQKALALHSQRHPRVPTNLLTGLLFDSAGRPMCVKAYTYKGRQIRYYASNVSAWARRRKLKRMRADGNGLEQLVIASLKTLLLDREQLRPILLGHGVHGVELDSLTRAGSTAARRFDRISDVKLGDVLRGILQRVELTASHVTLLMWIEELRRFLAWDGVGMFGTDADGRQRNPSIHFLCVAASVVRARKLFALPVPAAIWNGTPRVDDKLIRLLDDAERARTLMMVRRDLDLPGLAAAFGCKMDRYSRLVRLSYLAPDIALAIRDGMEPVGVTRRTLLAANIPLDWATQRTLLGFPPQPEHLRNPNATPVRPVPNGN